MKVKNPDFVKVEKGEAAAMSAVEAQMRAWFSSNTDKETVSFDQIRVFFNKSESQWPDGLIHEKLIEWGFSVVDG